MKFKNIYSRVKSLNLPIIFMLSIAFGGLSAISIAADNDSALGIPDYPIAGNPINPGNGNKFQIENDYIGSGVFPLEMTRTYNSLTSNIVGIGNWIGTYDNYIKIFQEPTFDYVRMFRNDGKTIRYELDALGNVIANTSLPGKLVRLKTNGEATGWKYTDESDMVENYDSLGRLKTITDRKGFSQQLTYDPTGKLIKVTDPAGRELNFSYDSENRIHQMRDPANNVYSYNYDDAGRLSGVTYPDTSTRTYLYNEQEHTQFTPMPYAMTGLIDEKGVRYATWKYNSDGLAISSQHAGGVELTTLNYGDIETSVTTPLGNIITYEYTRVRGKLKNTGISNSGCNCSQSASYKSYDENGFLTSSADFNGFPTNYVRDAYGRELSRTNPDGSIVSTQWHASFNLPLKITETNRVVTFTYDVLGNVLTKTIKSGTQTRIWTHTYTNGLLTKIDGPRTDVNDVTNITYNAQYSISTITNALGHVTQFTNYDAHGRPLTVVNPNGLTTTLVYDLKGRLINQKTGNLETSYQFDLAGQLTAINYPDSSYLQFTYDAAHRLIKKTDSLGNYIEYQLDAAGNRVNEFTRNSSNTIVNKLSRTFDPMSNLTKFTDGTNQATLFAYDGNGNLQTETDPLSNVTTYGYDDGMNRLTSVADAMYGTASYAYDPLGQLVSVTDANGYPTTYTINGLGNRQNQQSYDTGLTKYTFDAAGNILTSTDARNKKTTYVYDALNRNTKITFADGTIVTSLYDTGTYGLGNLSKITDPSGNTSWIYDQFGRVTSKTQTIGSVSLTTAYLYDSSGRLIKQTYPSGKELGFEYNEDQINKITLNGVTVAEGITYQPFNGLKQLTWGNGDTYLRNYDLAGRISAYGLSATLDTINYDAAGKITKISDGTTPGTSNYIYDIVNRLTEFNKGSTVEKFVYDSNGNRTEKNINGQITSYTYIAGNKPYDVTNPAMVTYTYLIDAAGNITKDSSRTFTYNAAGRMSKVVKGGVTTNYIHNGLGQRVNKNSTAPSIGTTLFVYDEDGKLLGEYTAAGTPIQETLWLDNIPVATTRASNIYYTLTDHLNSPRKIYNSNKVPVWSWGMDAWGSSLANQNPSGLGDFVYNYRFAGQYYDAETGLHYNYFRDYDPSIGRYIQSDPIGLGGGVNTYAYVDGDPINYVDPDGLTARRVVTTTRGQGLTNMEVRSLIRQIQQIDPAFSYPTVRPTGPQGRYGPSDIQSLQQSLQNAKGAGFCGPGASQMPGFLNNGQVSMGNFANFLPSGIPNTWVPSSTLPNGFNYQWTNNGVQFRLWGHGPNSAAPAGSFSQSNATTTLQVNGRTVTSTGTTVKNAKNQQNAPLVHLPLIP